MAELLGCLGGTVALPGQWVKVTFRLGHQCVITRLEQLAASPERRIEPTSS